MNKKSIEPRNEQTTSTRRVLALKKERLKMLSASELEGVVGGKCEVGTCDPGTWI